VHNTYVNRTVIVNNNSRVAYNGGPGGIDRRANRDEERWGRESHVQATSMQISHQNNARSNRANFASENHGRPATPAMSRVGERQAHQQERIANGVRSGQLTPHETGHIERQEGRINQQVHNDRAANGGHLTGQERAQVNREQNHVSREIQRDKHNDHVDHPAQHENAEHGRPHR
jgi:hypothetical protein